MDGESDEPGLPASIELAWGLRDARRRGPRPGLTLDRIVAAGIRVALTDGLGSVSMARVAAELGASTMSLYRHVAAKDELLTLMVDTALGAPPGADRDRGWRAGLAGWARAERAAYRRHPWALRVPITAAPLGPNNVAWLEDALRCLADTPLTEQEKLSAVLLVTGFVRNSSTLTADLAAGAARSSAGPGYGAALRRLTGADRFPALHRALDSGALDDGDEPDAGFDFGLARLLDGLAVFVDSRPARARGRSGPPGPPVG